MTPYSLIFQSKSEVKGIIRIYTCGIVHRGCPVQASLGRGFSAVSVLSSRAEDADSLANRHSQSRDLVFRCSAGVLVRAQHWVPHFSRFLREVGAEASHPIRVICDRLGDEGRKIQA